MPAQNSISFPPPLSEIRQQEFKDIVNMLTARILKTLKQHWTHKPLTPARSLEPLDHPSLQAMSLRELADLPLEPPPAPSHVAGVAASNPGKAAACRTPSHQPMRGTAIAAR